MKKYFSLLMVICSLFFFGCVSSTPVIAGQTYNPRFDSVRFSHNEKYALVLSGGGAKGSYEIGVFRAMKELAYPIDIVTGTSVGALNSMFIVMDDLAGAENLWRTVDETMIFTNPDGAALITDGRSGAGDVKLLLKDFVAGNLDSYEPLKALLKSSYNAEKFYSSPIDFGTVVFDVKTMSEKIILKKEIQSEKLPDYMLASAACYPAFAPYQVDGLVFIDGGYANNLPIDIAKQLGATKFVAVALGAPGTLTRESAELINSSDTVYISSYWDLGSMLFFNPQNAERNMRLGYLDAMKQFGAYEGRAYTFFNGSFTNLGDYNKQLEHIAVLPACLAFLNTHWEGRFSFDRIMLTAAEAAAELFDLNPLLLYRADLFKAHLQAKIKAVSVQRSSMKTADPLKIVFDLVARFQAVSSISLDGKTVVKNLPADAQAAAQKNPKEFFAASYIYFADLEP